MKQNRLLPVPQDARMLLAAATNEGAAFGQVVTAQPVAIRYTYTPELFGYLVAEVLKHYTPAERAAFRVGFLGAMREVDNDS